MMSWRCFPRVDVMAGASPAILNPEATWRMELPGTVTHLCERGSHHIHHIALLLDFFNGWETWVLVIAKTLVIGGQLGHQMDSILHKWISSDFCTNQSGLDLRSPNTFTVVIQGCHPGHSHYYLLLECYRLIKAFYFCRTFICFYRTLLCP